MTQLELYERTEDRLVYVTRDDLPPREALHCPPPEPGLLDSMRKNRWNGVIKLSGMPDGKNFVRDGERRIWAWDILAEEEKEKGLEPYWSSPSMQVAAYYREWSGLEDLTEKFQTNKTARPNHIADFEVVRRMAQNGMSPEEIGRATKTRVTGINKLLKLLNLDQELLDGFIDGDIPYTAADMLAGMSKERQERAVMRLLANGKLTVQDVKDLRRVAAKAALDGMAQGMFDEMQVQFWNTMVEGDVATIALPDGRKFEVDKEDLVAWLESREEAA